jgi:hypothetical protein
MLQKLANSEFASRFWKRVPGFQSSLPLGLAITERAVKLHAGTVSASNATGATDAAGGLIVGMKLPVAPTAS